MSTLARSAASAALDALVSALEDAGIEATRDPGAFHHAPLGVLVGLPSLTRKGLQSHTYTVPVYVVSSDPLTGPANVDALYALADEVALALRTSAYTPTDWRGGVNQEPLPAVQLDVVCTVPLLTSEPTEE